LRDALRARREGPDLAYPINPPLRAHGTFSP
jgi:hypothetical protein